MDGGGSQPKSVQTSSNSAPWAPTQPGLKQGIKDWTALYNAGGLTPHAYPGQTLADTAPETSQGWESIMNTANDPNMGVGAATKANNALLTGDYAALQPLIDKTRDSVNGNFEAAGRYGGGYHDRGVSEGVGTVLANATQGAIAAAPTLQSASYVPGQAMLGVGEQRQQTAQDQIAENIKKFNLQDTARQTAIQQYLAGLSGGWGGSVTGTQPVQGTGSNDWMQLAGLGAQAAASYFGS